MFVSGFCIVCYIFGTVSGPRISFGINQVLVYLNLQVFDTVMYSLISAVASTLKLNYESRYKVIYLSLDSKGLYNEIKVCKHHHATQITEHMQLSIYSILIAAL